MDRNRWVWGILLLFPLLGSLLVVIFMMLIAGAILDRLNALVARSRTA